MKSTSLIGLVLVGIFIMSCCGGKCKNAKSIVANEAVAAVSQVEPVQEQEPVVSETAPVEEKQEEPKQEKPKYENGDIIILQFGAVWCGPCRVLAPKLEEMSLRFPEIPFYKVDTETADQELVAKFQVQALPTVVIMINLEVQSIIKGLDLNQIEQALLSVEQVS